MNRRKALKNLGLSLGTITLSPAVLSLLQSCKNDLDWNPSFFNTNQISVISELTDIIIPSDNNIPGSKELNLIKFIDLYIYNISNNNDQVLLKKSLDTFLNDCLEKSDKNNYEKLNRNDLESSIEYFFKTKKDSHNKWRQAYNKNKNESIEKNILLIEAFSYNFLNTIRQLTITAFKGNEYIGENVLAYVPIPGQQKGCVDLQETTGGRAWSL
ncbi:MAG: hypothetical protein CMC38_06740 [Flavobacteriaceae bacterium]|nr:hypothetical protein [Flavobacteriaceae bacterium]|tara:strand:+ start:1158 stop:1796 length:639 start_codon:yes stop_codon:yes gene_type:complete